MDFEVAKDRAIKYLMLSKKTESEVRIKLKKSGYSEDTIHEVIGYLTELRYINDEEYVDAYIRQCTRLLTHSIYEIKNKLLQKGISKYIIEERLEELNNTDYEERLIQKLLQGKLNNMDELKQKKYLYRRGLSKNNEDY